MTKSQRKPQEDCGEDFDVTVMRLHQERAWRPTAGVVLLNSEGQVGVGLQNNPERNWTIPQGGVENLEPFMNAVFRELREEIGILPRQLTMLAPRLHAGYVEFNGSAALEGFSLGKWYGIVGMRLHHAAAVNIVPPDGSFQEILEWLWLSPAEAIRYCVEQPGVQEARPSTLEKGRRILAPAIHALTIR